MPCEGTARRPPTANQKERPHGEHSRAGTLASEARPESREEQPFPVEDPQAVVFCYGSPSRLGHTVSRFWTRVPRPFGGGRAAFVFIPGSSPTCGRAWGRSEEAAYKVGGRRGTTAGSRCSLAPNGGRKGRFPPLRTPAAGAAWAGAGAG